jgi:hypothetical protein
MEDHLDKQAIGRELTDSIAEARQLRVARDSDVKPQDYLRLKEWQSARLARTYADLLANPRYRPAAEVFLSDLYGPKDFRTRDEELARVVPIMVRMLPARALLALLDAVRMDTLSESLDTAMVLALRHAGTAASIDWPAYGAAYRRCGRRKDRELQIDLIDRIGNTLDRLTRMPLIHISLALMKKPAQLSGLSALHSVLQRGFDAFYLMKGADEFLAIITQRETALMQDLFSNPDARQKAPTFV